MKRDVKSLENIGRILFGNIWQSELARALEISDRTMRRYISGTSPLPSDLWQKLHAVCETRAQAISKLAQSIQN